MKHERAHGKIRNFEEAREVENNLVENWSINLGDIVEIVCKSWRVKQAGTSCTFVRFSVPCLSSMGRVSHCSDSCIFSRVYLGINEEGNMGQENSVEFTSLKSGWNGEAKYHKRNKDEHDVCACVCIRWRWQLMDMKNTYSGRAIEFF